MNRLVTIPDIINDRDCSLFISFINDNLDVFESYSEESNPLRMALRFGIDDVYKSSLPDLSMIPGLHNALRRLFTNLTTTVQDVVGGPKLYVTSFHMGKQFPGSEVSTHIDCDPGYNSHFKYSTVVYLNTTNSGDLFFTKQNLSYSPRAKEVAVFPSMGDEWEHEVKQINEDRYNLPIWLTEDPAWELSFFA